MLPKAELYAADTFIGTGANSLRTNALLLGKGLDWLLEKQASVVNASLTGPDNKLLREVIKRLNARNIAVVAAAGNGGPSAPPAFPAAYPEAIAVTAVDQLLRPYRLANRGEYVTVAAPGVRIWTPGPRGGQYSNGTSFADPLRHRRRRVVAPPATSPDASAVDATVARQRPRFGRAGKGPGVRLGVAAKSGAL